MALPFTTRYGLSEVSNPQQIQRQTGIVTSTSFHTQAKEGIKLNYQTHNGFTFRSFALSTGHLSLPSQTFEGICHPHHRWRGQCRTWSNNVPVPYHKSHLHCGNFNRVVIFIAVQGRLCCVVRADSISKGGNKTYMPLSNLTYNLFPVESKWRTFESISVINTTL